MRIWFRGWMGFSLVFKQFRKTVIKQRTKKTKKQISLLLTK